MRITNDVLEELKKVRRALDDLYKKLDVSLHEKKGSSKKTNPPEEITSNFKYIADKLKSIENESHVIGES